MPGSWGALGVDAGLVVITKTDLAAPDSAAEQARELLPGVGMVIAHRAPPIAGRRWLPGWSGWPSSFPAGHRDGPDRRSCTWTAASRSPAPGRSVTGTLVSGAIRLADRLTLYPHEREVRVRGLEVHGEPVAAAVAGQRVAVNVARAPSGGLQRGDALASAGALRPSFVIDIAADALGRDPPPVVHAHHGTRVTAARVVRRAAAGVLRLRCRQALLIAPGTWSCSATPPGGARSAVGSVSHLRARRP